MKIFITGGAGFLGRALLRRADKFWPNHTGITVYSRDSSKHHQVRRAHPDITFIPGDIADYDRLRVAMAGHDLIIHAAAFKYVPDAELYPMAAIADNIIGSHNVVEAAKEVAAKRVIGISTDKACQPVNMYGLTKLAMERIFAHAEYEGDPDGPKFIVVRYGNVVSSTGSVIPMFREAVHSKEHIVEVTNQKMTRFWLTMNEACGLIHFASTVMEAISGSVIIPRLGACNLEAVVRACAIIEDVGPGGISVHDTGHRPGEKVHEMLLSPVEADYATQNDQVYLLAPMTSGPINEAQRAQGLYSSNTPRHEITAVELAKMIEESDEEERL